MTERIKSGDIVKHFKRAQATQNIDNLNDMVYLYEVIQYKCKSYRDRRKIGSISCLIWG